MKRSENMIQHTENAKKNSIQKVQDAIDVIKATGRRVTRKEILEISGVSNALLSKPYIKEVLQQNQVLMYEPKPIATPCTEITLQKTNEKLQLRVDKLNDTLQNRDLSIKSLRIRLEETRKKLDESRNENEILRGKLQSLLEVIYRSGINDGTLDDYFQ